MEKREKRGGTREGSGRKSKSQDEKKKTISVTLDPNIANWTKENGGSKFINNILKGAKMKKGNLLGETWSSLIEEEKELLLNTSNIDIWDKKSGDCIINFENGLSIAAKKILTEDEYIIEILDDSILYNSKDN